MSKPPSNYFWSVPMSIKTRIRKQRRGGAMTIPMAVLKMAELDIGQEVSLVIENGRLIIEPTRRNRRFTMSELLKGSDVIRRLTVETAWARQGGAVGNEID
jgi:antitoxin ChpS